MKDTTAGTGDHATNSIPVKSPKDVVFNIHHNYQTHKVVISDHATVGKHTVIYLSI